MKMRMFGMKMRISGMKMRISGMKMRMLDEMRMLGDKMRFRACPPGVSLYLTDLLPDERPSVPRFCLAEQIEYRPAGAPVSPTCR
ncbi:hypothetical protein CgunFtcFv8_004815 [Champsocephalus gunnari]|uniref:Uncharacterized protein n=1 Tax=Champsocephalus gunnari TaxID=52237 RepID=A0AAN8E1B3_CHAGU|nr:hypothetical protein CgunFtcFv8_004815 [Champsocephalus gunnari]